MSRETKIPVESDRTEINKPRHTHTWYTVISWLSLLITDILKLRNIPSMRSGVICPLTVPSSPDGLLLCIGAGSRFLGLPRLMDCHSSSGCRWRPPSEQVWSGMSTGDVWGLALSPSVHGTSCHQGHGSEVSELVILGVGSDKVGVGTAWEEKEESPYQPDGSRKGR